MPVKYQLIPSGTIHCNAVVLWDPTSRAALVVDPSDDGAPVLSLVRREQLRVELILLTHAHFDHASAAEAVAASLGCDISLHAADRALYASMPAQGRAFGLALPEPRLCPKPLTSEQTVAWSGAGLVRVLHVPGHSPGSVAFHLPALGVVIAGDTLFFGGVGRTDLPGGSSAALARSIKETLFGLPDECLVIPGHGPTTTIGREKRQNPFVHSFT